MPIIDTLIQITESGLREFHHLQRRRILIEKEFDILGKHKEEVNNIIFHILERVAHGQQVFLSHFKREEYAIRGMVKDGLLRSEPYKTPTVYRITYA